MKSSVAMIVSFTPWVLFGVIVKWAGPDHAAIAALVAFAVAAVLLVKNSWHSQVKIIDAAGAATFGILAVVGFTGGIPADNWIADFGRGAVTLLLAAIMLVSAATVPFTEQYARESVPRQYWGSPVFRATNRKISAMWGAVIAIAGGAHLAAGALAPVTDSGHAGQSSPVVNVLLNWVVPIALIMFATKQTQRIKSSARTQVQQASSPTSAPGDDAPTTSPPPPTTGSRPAGFESRPRSR